MQIDIWSDIRCPFCYIGKRKFEIALEKFVHKNEVEVIWRSFQLDPTLKTQTDISLYDYFAQRKGFSRQQAIQMNNNVTQIAKEVGLDFHLDKAVVANSFNAHRLIQLAKTKELGDEAEEQLFKAYFAESKNIDDTAILVETGIAAGLDEKEVREMLASDAFAKAVKTDELAAHEIGVRGVPFFVFDNKYAVSGAQSSDVFLQALEKSWETFEKEDALITAEGEACAADRNCN